MATKRLPGFNMQVVLFRDKAIPEMHTTILMDSARFAPRLLRDQGLVELTGNPSCDIVMVVQ